jgi:hypothetical protein
MSSRPNEYHHLEVRVAKPGLIARTRQGYYSQPGRTGMFTAESEKLGAPEEGAAAVNTGNQSYYANAHPYLDEPLAQLVERIPELKTLQPAPDQQELPVILQKMGRRVDDFVRDIGDLIAHEDVTQEKLNAKGDVKAKENFQDNYLILHHGNEWGGKRGISNGQEGESPGANRPE